MNDLDNLNIHIIDCSPSLRSIIVSNPTKEEISIIEQLKSKLNFSDEYMGYSPEQQKFYSDLKTYIKEINKFIPHKEL